MYVIFCYLKIRLAVLKEKYQPYIDNAAQLAKEKIMATIDRIRANPTINLYMRKLSTIDIYHPYRMLKMAAVRRVSEFSEKYATEMAQARKVLLWINKLPATQRTKEFVMDKIDNVS